MATMDAQRTGIEPALTARQYVMTAEQHVAVAQKHFTAAREQMALAQAQITAAQELVTAAATHVPEMQRLALSAKDAADVLAVGHAVMYRLLMSGELKSIKVGRRRLVPVRELEAFIARKIAEGF